MFKYTGDLAQDIFPEFAIIQAQLRVQELSDFALKLLTHKTINDLEKTLCSEIEERYETLPKFKTMKSANEVRDFVIVFSKHWLSSICKTKYPEIYELIPQDYRMGRE